MKGAALFEAVAGKKPQRFQIPKKQELSYRIAGGTATILEKLTKIFQ
jgi:hypothetical protein